MRKATIDGITVTTNFDAEMKELENYVEYVTLRVDEPVTNIHVTTCDDGCVDVTWIAHNQKFERIRRITGK